MDKQQIATFGAGCFWGVEARFRQLDGVLDTAVGFMGGWLEEPTYEQVCNLDSGHAEVVQISFNPELVDYRQLLAVFWDNHNPTTLNRQGPDIGSQYRSAIFYHDDDQQKVAELSKRQLTESGRWSEPIVTEIAAAQTFYRAEDYHQQYLEKRGLTSCRI